MNGVYQISTISGLAFLAFGINRAAERNRFPVVAFSDAGHVYIKRTDEMGED